MKMKRLVIALATTFCAVGTVLSASAAPSVASKAAGEFGTLTGRLEDSTAEALPNNGLIYEFSFSTQVVKSPGSCRLYANVSLQNNSTGVQFDTARDEYFTPGDDFATGYVQLDHYPAVRGQNGITVGVYGSHEARYTNAYVVYTRKTYNLKRDHGLV